MEVVKWLLKKVSLFFVKNVMKMGWVDVFCVFDCKVYWSFIWLCIKICIVFEVCSRGVVLFYWLLFVFCIEFMWGLVVMMCLLSEV